MPIGDSFLLLAVAKVLSKYKIRQSQYITFSSVSWAIETISFCTLQNLSVCLKVYIIPALYVFKQQIFFLRNPNVDKEWNIVVTLKPFPTFISAVYIYLYSESTQLFGNDQYLVES